MEITALWMSDDSPETFTRLNSWDWPLDGAATDTQASRSVSSDRQGERPSVIAEPSSSLQTVKGPDSATSSRTAAQTETPATSAFTDAGTYSFDGTQNNPLQPDWGAIQTPLISVAPLAYADDVSTPAGGNRPNPRVISNALAQQDISIPDPRGLTNFIWAWGQFLDHDLDLTPELSAADAAAQGRFISIPVPAGDPYLDPTGSGTVTIELRDTVTIEGTGTDPSNPSQLPNVVTTWMDGSQVYGSSEERARALRSFSGGELLISAGNLLPLNTLGLENDNPTGRPAELLFVAGDVRANENVVLSSMHTLFVREHNRLAQELRSAHPTWSDEQLYQSSRRINIAQMQSITYNEYLPTLLGPENIPSYGGYEPTVNPGISRTFSTAAFRLGHTQLSSEILRLDVDGAVIAEGNLSLAASFFPGSGALQQAGIEPILRGLAASVSQRVDTEVISDVRNLLFGFGPAATARDLFAINIQRGRVNGLADYNTIREAFGLPRVRSFAEITSDPSKQAALVSLYPSVNTIDAFVGLLAEDHLPGASVGKTIYTVLLDQFSRLRASDRLYFEHALSPETVASVQSVRLSDIILRNTDTDRIQANVFHSGDIRLALRISTPASRSLGDLSQSLGRPEVLTFRYTAGAMQHNAQDADKTSLWGAADDDPVAYIIVTDEKDPSKLPEGKAPIYFAGSVSWGQQFTASAHAADMNHFKATTHVFVYDDEAAYRRGDGPLQNSTFITSGSQPLCLGDVFGPLTLMGYRGKDGERSLPDPLDMEADPSLEVASPSPILVTMQVSNPGRLALKDIELQSQLGPAPQWMGGDTNANKLLDPGEVWTYMTLQQAQLGHTTLTVDLRAKASDTEGADLGLPALSDSESIHYLGVPLPPAGDLTRLFGDPLALCFRYVATNEILTAGKDNDQDGKAKIVSGVPDDDSQAYLVVSSSQDVEKIKAGDKPLYFAGIVETGQLFSADLDFTNQKRFTNAIDVLVFEDESAWLAGDRPLQVVSYHTSGSQPMGLGDLIGAVQLEGYEGEDGAFEPAGTDVITGTVGEAFSLVGLFGKPEALTFRYDAGTDLLTGGKGSNQDGKAQRLGLRRPDADGTSFIRVTDRERPDDLSGQEFFEGMVSQDTTFTASHAAPGAKADGFSKIIYIHYFENFGGPHLGSVSYSADGSQPIHFGDRLAGSTLVGFAGEDGSALLG